MLTFTECSPWSSGGCIHHATDGGQTHLRCYYSLYVHSSLAAMEGLVLVLGLALGLGLGLVLPFPILGLCVLGLQKGLGVRQEDHTLPTPMHTTNTHIHY